MTAASQMAIRDAARRLLGRRADHHALGPERAGFPGGRGRRRGELAPQHGVGSILGGRDEDDLVSSLQPAAPRVQLRFAISDDTCTGSSSGLWDHTSAIAGSSLATYIESR